MMCSKIFLVFFVIILSSTCIFASPKIIGPNDDREILCEDKKCIPKCCEHGKYYNSTSMMCIDSEKEYDFNDLPVYGPDSSSNGILKKLTDKKLDDIWSYLVPGRMYEEIVNGTIFADSNPFLAEENRYESYLTESGQVYLRYTDELNSTCLELVPFFCVEYVTNSSDDVAKPQIVSVMLDIEDEEKDKRKEKEDMSTYYCLIISSVFLVLVLLVYIILPELRNLGGKILMAYVVSLLLVFIIVAKMKIAKFRPSTCIYITALVYFGTMSSFCWLNVMSLDIWWTFRGYAKARPIHRRGENFKFCMYCLYGWGLPVIMTIGLVVVNETDLSQWPWIITPDIPAKGCVLLGTRRSLYMYIPMTILIVSNWMFFLMTAYNIRRLMRGTSILNSESTAAGNPKTHRRERIRLMLYLKLSVIMGINWLFEIISSINPEFALWKVSDNYNIFTGVAIFFIFVFKKKIYYKLKLRFCELFSCFHKSPSTQITTKRKLSESINSQSTRLQSIHANSSSK